MITKTESVVLEVEKAMLLRRLISSVFLIALVIFTIFVSPIWFFTLVACAIITLGLWEFYAIIEKKGIPVSKYFGILLGLAIPLNVFFRIEPSRFWELCLIVAGLLVLFILQFTRRESSQATVGISTTLFGILYISLFFSFIIKLRLIHDLNALDGSKLVAYLLAVTKSGDIAAYFVGSKLGKHHLIPRISPKKTIEGTIGGFLACLLVSVASSYFFPHIPLRHFVILGILLGVLAQVGDLSESLIKRDCEVKDASSLLPGLGGMLDVIDSLLFTAPILYFYVRIFL